MSSSVSIRTMKSTLFQPSFQYAGCSSNLRERKPNALILEAASAMKMLLNMYPLYSRMSTGIGPVWARGGKEGSAGLSQSALRCSLVKILF